MTITRPASRVLLCTAMATLAIAGTSACGSSAPSGGTAPPPASTAASAPNAALAAPYKSPDGYTISPPDGWVLHPTTGVAGLSSVFVNPTPDTGGQKPFADNVNVLIQPTSDNLDAVVAQSKQQAPSVLPNYKMTTDQSTTVNGIQGHLLGGTYDQENIGPVQNLQLTVVSNGKSYTTTVTATQPNFAQVEALANAVLASFTLGN